MNVIINAKKNHFYRTDNERERERISQIFIQSAISFKR